MRRVNFSYKDFEEMIEKYNPFGFKQEDGKIEMYVDYGVAYFDCMKKIYEQFPKGLVDLILFLHQATTLPIRDAEREFKRMIPFVGNCELIAVDFITPTRESLVREMRPIMKALHTITETKFNESYFLQAVDKFLVWHTLKKACE